MVLVILLIDGRLLLILGCWLSVCRLQIEIDTALDIFDDASISAMLLEMYFESPAYRETHFTLLGGKFEIQNEMLILKRELVRSELEPQEHAAALSQVTSLFVLALFSSPATFWVYLNTNITL